MTQETVSDNSDNSIITAIETKICFVLGIYPRISPTMLQMGLGASFPPEIWKPVLNNMVQQGTITLEEIQLTSPVNRQQTYKILSLTNQPLQN